MGFFQKKPDIQSSAPLYSLGLNKSLLVVGLGNIGKEFDGSRHNVGFACVDELASKLEFDPWIVKKDLKCQITTKTVNGNRVILIKPTTMMNLSGEAVQAVSHFYKIPAENIAVIHDELDIPFGQIRTRVGGSDAGNNGIKSVIEHCGKEFGRIRVGIKAETKMDSADFVLAKFSKAEKEQLPALLKEATAILSEYVHGSQLKPETRSFIL
jgi:PTH1 family peptidyl-tRNA hydrolase